jgi:hypothetical protein
LTKPKLAVPAETVKTTIRVPRALGGRVAQLALDNKLAGAPDGKSAEAVVIKALEAYLKGKS